MGQQELVRGELARRELARRRLIHFTEYTFPQYRRAPVHELLARYLEQVERYIRTGGREGIGRLMVFMPPRHGKSELVSTRLPAWFLGRNPDMRVILTSVTASLATGFSRRVRNIIRDEAFQAAFGRRSGLAAGDQVYLSEDRRAVEAWDLGQHRGGLVAAGVGGSIIGRGAHLGVIDDPFKDRTDAESEAVRDRVDAWYRSTFYTRLEDGAAVVLMHQRWHSDDLAGRLLVRMLEEDGADQWTVLSLPAVGEDWAAEDDGRGNEQGVFEERVIEALRSGWWMSRDPLGREAGEALWAEKYPVGVLDRIRVNLGSYEFDALYQQRPQRPEGALIKARQIPVVDGDAVPGDVRWIRYWDLGVGRSSRAHYCVGALCGMDRKKNFYIGDVAMHAAPWSDARPKITRTMLEDPVEVAQYVEVFGQQDGYYQEMRDDDELHLRSIKPYKTVGDKEARAQLWASRIPDGKVFMVRGPWNDEFVACAVAFPNGAYDDPVDAVSGGYQACPGYVSMSEVPQDPGRPSVWDPFHEMAGAGRVAVGPGRQTGRWVV